MAQDNYWTRRLNRRGMLGGTAAVGVGAAALLAVGCGGDDDASSATGATKPAGTTAPDNAAKPGGAGTIVNGQEKYLGKTPVRGGTLRQSYTTDPITWDPHQTTSINTHLRTALFNSPLLQYRFGPQYGIADVTASANLASKWEQTDDTTVTFKLDPKAKWTSRAPLNGRALTSKDVAFSLNRILTLPAPYAALYQVIDKMETPDDATLVLKLKQPYAPLFNYLAHYYSQIVAPEVVSQFGDLKSVDSAKALGIGPFELESWQPNTEMRFKRRDGYFRENQPYLDGVVLRNQADPNAALASIRAGETDTFGLTLENKDSVIQARKDVVVSQALSVVAWLITLRSDVAPTSDARVRQGIAMAIDRKGWLDSLYGGQGAIDNGPIQTLWSDWRLPPGQLGEGDKFLKYDPAEAKKLLSAAGVDSIKADFKFTAAYGAAVAAHPELLKDLLSKVGITLNVDIMEYGAFVGAVMNSKPTYQSMSYVGVRFMGDPDEMLWDMYHPTGSKNFAKINDAELTKLLEKQRQTLDAKARKSVVDDIQKYLAVKQYYVYTPAFAQIDGWLPSVANFRNHVSYDTGNMLREVWIDPTLKS